jgi:hypothetical protein
MTKKQIIKAANETYGEGEYTIGGERGEWKLLRWSGNVFSVLATAQTLEILAREVEIYAAK